MKTIPPRGRYAARVVEQDDKIRLADRLPSLTSLPRRPGTRSTLSPQVPQHCVEPQHVGLNAEPGDEPDASLRQQRTQAALLDVGHMDLDIGDGHRAEAVAKRIPGEQKRGRVHHEALDALLDCAVKSLDRLALAMRVEDEELVLVGSRVLAQHGVQLRGRSLAVE